MFEVDIDTVRERGELIIIATSCLTESRLSESWLKHNAGQATSACDTIIVKLRLAVGVDC